MARRLWLCGLLAATALGCAGEPGARGAKGDPGESGVDGGAGSGATGKPSLSGVAPGSVFLARAVDVTLSGAGTAWTEAVTADFGAKITVKALTVASPTALVAQGGAEIEPNDSKNLALSNGALTPPWVTRAATLKDASDEDWYAVNVDAAHVGKAIRAQTSGLDPRTDTVVDIFELSGNMLIPLGPMGSPSEDSGYLDELTSVATPTVGTYFVKVSASPYFDPAHTGYDVIIRLE